METIEMLQELEKKMKRSVLCEQLLITNSTISRWLRGTLGIGPRSGLAIKHLYESMSSCLDKLEK